MITLLEPFELSLTAHLFRPGAPSCSATTIPQYFEFTEFFGRAEVRGCPSHNSSFRRSSFAKLGHNYPDFTLNVDLSNFASTSSGGQFIATGSYTTSTVGVRR
jgi:hypothetical protein